MKLITDLYLRIKSLIKSLKTLYKMLRLEDPPLDDED